MTPDPKFKPSGQNGTHTNTHWNRDELLAMIAHEVGNSTQGILSWIELIYQRPDSAELLSQGRDVIRRNGRLQSRLIKQLVQLARTQNSDLWIDHSSVALRPILEGAIKAMTPQLLTKSITLQADLDQTSISVVGDASELEEIFINLLSNSIKFTPTGGRVDVRLRCSRVCAQITVSDTGRGISAEFLPHVFERFRQERAGETDTQGLGLGLAIVRFMVERHGGNIYALSPGEGMGATFIVSLPLCAGSIVRPVLAQPLASAARPSG